MAFHNSGFCGDLIYLSFKVYQIAAHGSFIMPYIVYLPMLYKKGSDCWLSLYAKQWIVKHKRSAGDIAFLNFVSFFAMAGQTKLSKYWKESGNTGKCL